MAHESRRASPPPEPGMPARAPALRRALRRVAQAVRTLVGWFPISFIGLLVIGGSLVAFLYYGLRRIDLVLLVVGGMGLGVAALGLLFTLVAGLVVWVAARKQPAGQPLRLECGYFADTGFSVPSFWYLPFVHVSWTWRRPDGVVRLVRRRRRLCEEVQPQRRITGGGIVRRFEIGDIFGLTRITFERVEHRPVRFLPWIGSLKQMHVVRGMAGGEDVSHPEGPPEGDRYDMRRYAPGDPVRYVLWKVFAKSRQLLIRTPEQAISPARQTLAYLVTSGDDEAAAGAARVAVDGGAFGREWKFGADGCGEVAETKDHALELLVQSARSSAEQSGTGLGSFLTKATRGGVGRAVVFVPSRPGPWLKRVVSATGAAGGKAGRVEVVVGTDGIERAPRLTWLRRLLFGRRKDELPGAPRRTTDRELSTVVRALAAARVNVLVVDRAAGQIYTQQHLGSLRA